MPTGKPHERPLPEVARRDWRFMRGPRVGAERRQEDMP